MGLFQWLSGLQIAFVEKSGQKLVSLGKRDYVENASYMLPKDNQEIDRLDLQHYILRYILQENYVAPLQKPYRILDVGCGTGRWAVEMAEVFPSAGIVGIDLIKPTLEFSQRPKNVLFLQRDVLKGLPFTDCIFDYAHMRFLIAALPVKNFQSVVNELVRVVRPGGWVELVEPGWLVNAGEGLETLWKWLVEFGRRQGMDMLASSRLNIFLKEAGLVNISYKEVDIPVGDYAGQVGRLSANNILSLVEAVRAPIVALNIASAENYDQMLAKAKAELSHPEGCCSGPMRIVIGQQRA